MAQEPFIEALILKSLPRWWKEGQWTGEIQTRVHMQGPSWEDCSAECAGLPGCRGQ